ncbi:MAG: sigma-70 family RNA polymerase sigma factor [Sedimentisphaerales bacterium]|nr:sigma-70 family RNA polymerase sigma factor [Sedimentisphaerales bacterium]
MGNAQKIQAKNILQLVEAGRAGDRAAFDELVLLYQRRAMRLAIRILGDADEAAEAVQAGFVNAYLNIGGLKTPEHFENWLLRIVTNAAINQARTAKRRVDKIKIAGLGRKKRSITPPDRESAEELKEAIKRAMTKLSKKEAKAMALFGLEDLSHKQVAGIMGCTVAAAKWHVFRARKKLKVLLKDYL